MKRNEWKVERKNGTVCLVSGCFGDVHTVDGHFRNSLEGELAGGGEWISGFAVIVTQFRLVDWGALAESSAHMDAMHPYEKLPLFGTGLTLGVVMVVVHLILLVKAPAAQAFLKRFPRDVFVGQILVGFGLIWFWMLIAPKNMGLLSSLAMDLGEFNNVKPFLQVAVPVAVVLVSISVRDFLAVRALGLVGLMVAYPLLAAAYLEDPQSRLLIPIYAYGLIVASLFSVGMPYLFRDGVTWVTATAGRWKAACLAGLVYGLAIVICALAFWRGY